MIVSGCCGALTAQWTDFYESNGVENFIVLAGNSAHGWNGRMISQLNNPELVSYVDLVASPNPGQDTFDLAAAFTWVTFVLRLPIYVLVFLALRRIAKAGTLLSFPPVIVVFEGIVNNTIMLYHDVIGSMYYHQYHLQLAGLFEGLPQLFSVPTSIILAGLFLKLTLLTILPGTKMVTMSADFCIWAATIALFGVQLAQVIDAATIINGFGAGEFLAFFNDWNIYQRDTRQEQYRVYLGM
jgi:hypothetical protein